MNVAPSGPALAEQAFERTTGAPLLHGNSVRLLRDAAENYPAWLEAIRAAQHEILFENYIFNDDTVGRRFADALADQARAGRRVYVAYDWFGCLGKSSAPIWRLLRAAGVEVRCYNPPRLSQPLAVFGRDHRKSLVVDRSVAFVTGLCVGQMWEGYPERNLAGWRDTGVALRGPAVDDVAAAFADTWAWMGEPLAANEALRGPAPAAGDIDVRVIASMPGIGSIYRLDPLMASLARRTLWLTDAYFAGTASYVEALRLAATDGVDVRLLVPGAGSDVPLMQAVSRAGYRALLEGGVRVFEWNGPMLHAKTAVADAHWARVGSTNLNVSSWFGNRELDVVVENEAFGRSMEAMFEADLTQATEIVLQRHARVRPIAGAAVAVRRRRAGGSGTRATAGALRIGNVLGSALSARRVHAPTERRLMVQGGIALALIAVCTFLWPRLLAWPAAALSLWLGLALLASAARWRAARPHAQPDPAAIPAQPTTAVDEEPVQIGVR